VLESSPKSHQARVIDLDPETTALLQRRRERQQQEREDFGAGYNDLDLVTCAEDGSPIHPQSFSQAFATAIERADLRKIRLHDLRHTHATIAVKAGVPVKVISERLGHESPAFTLKQYAHVVPGMQAEAAGLIAAVVAGCSAAGQTWGTVRRPSRQWIHNCVCRLVLLPQCTERAQATRCAVTGCAPSGRPGR
jgi:hypothetical protein